MAFNYGNTGQSPFGGGGAPMGTNSSIHSGPDLADIQTEALGFLSLAGEAKVRLLPSPWPADNLPAPTSSLMSVAPNRGLLAAAGPDSVIIASTESVRKAFEAPREGDSHNRQFQPQLIIPMPRLSQVAFTADENYLVLSAEQGGGLAVYAVQSLLQGSTASTFEIGTNSLSLRALVPNPAPETGELVAIVTSNGNLMMANLKEKSILSGANGQILKDGVSCISWSAKGKQLVAGLGDGTVFQMTPEGVGKGEIPRPPKVDPNHHVSSITWLENHVFLVVHTPTTFEAETAPPSTFNLVTRQVPKGSPPEHIYQTLNDPAQPFGLNRSPPHHFLLRLRDFPPNLQDLIIVASTASVDVGLFTRSKVPLVSDKPAEQVTNVFTMTEMADDSKRAQLSISDAMVDTSPIGVCLDLSSREKVLKPIPADEIDESPTPLPALMVLNNEGILASWWVVYADSIRQGVGYPGLVADGGSQQSLQNVPAQSQPTFGAAVAKPGFGQSTFGTSATPTPAFGAPTTPTPTFGGFNKPVAPAFGSASSVGGSSAPAFGSQSGLAKAASPWGTAASTATSTAIPVFGSTTAPTTQGVAFGNSGVPGNRASPWSAANTAPTAVFGKPGSMSMGSGVTFGAPSTSGVFGSSSNSAAPSSSGFASFANKGGFAAAAAGPGSNVFGSKPATGGFASAVGNIGMDTSSSFGSFNNTQQSPSGGLALPGGFSLGSTFKPDGSAKDDGPKPANPGGSFFGSGFGTTLNDAQKAPIVESPEADMDADEPAENQQVQEKTPAQPAQPVQTPLSPILPPSTSVASKFQLPPAKPSTNSLFGTSGSTLAFPASNTTAKSAGFNFGTSSVPTENTKVPTSGSTLAFPASNTTAKSAGFNSGTPSVPPENTKVPTTSTTSFFSQTPKGSEVKIKLEQDSTSTATTDLANIPEAPLPPDPTQTALGTGKSSISSIEPDAPLPPDFAPAPISKPASLPSLPASATRASEAEKYPPVTTESDIPTGPEDDGDDRDFDFETDDDGANESGHFSEEGSGEDITKDLSPDSGSHQTLGLTPQSSFGGHSGGRDIIPGNPFTKTSKPVQESTSRSLFGEVGGRNAPVLPPPKPLISPRSPSPIRAALPGRLLRQEPIRSVSAPGIASQMLGSRPVAPAVKNTFAFSIEQKRAEERRVAEARAKKEAEESQALIDEEDEKLQNIIGGDVVGTKTLDDFIAHHDYVGSTDNNSIPAQVEAVYRDINSMIDTLGVNSHALKCFIKGHTEQYRDEGRTREDLEEDDEWCLVEIEDLSSLIEKDLTRELAQGRVYDVEGKLEVSVELEKDLVKLRAKQEDISMILSSMRDPDHLLAIRSQPLTAEQSSQQHDLRRDFTKLQKLLAEAEECLTLLRAKLASQSVGRGQASAGPTVEAVMRTIKKMTSMAEKRSGDIDVLENQMRKLRFSSVASPGSREGSPFATPNAKSSIRNPATYGLFYTPESSKSTRGFHASFASSTQSYNRATPPRKKLSGFSAEDKARLRAHAARRTEVKDKLRAALQNSGTLVRSMDDE